MSDTYQTHKAAIDIAYPTPPIDWARQDDHVTFGHHEVATVEVTFNGHAYHYLGAHRQLDGVEDWEILRVVAGSTTRTRAVGGHASWSDAKAAFEIYWEALCEVERRLLAASAYGKDVVDDQPGDTPQVRLSFLHVGGVGQATIPINPGLSDERFEYAATTSLETVTMTATVPVGRRCGGSLSTSSPWGRLGPLTCC